MLLLNAGTNNDMTRIHDANEWIAKSGHARTYAANHLGHFLLTNILAPRLTQNARVVVVSSLAAWWANPRHGFMRHYQPQEYQGKKVNFIPLVQHTRPYESSKLCNVCVGRTLRERLKSKKVTVTLMTPGLVNTEINNNDPAFPSIKHTAATAEAGGDRLFESLFVTRPGVDFVYPYWFPEAVYSREASWDILYEGWRYKHKGYMARPEKFELWDYNVYASVGPECSERKQRELWIWSRKAVGLPARLDTGNLFQSDPFELIGNVPAAHRGGVTEAAPAPVAPPKLGKGGRAPVAAGPAGTSAGTPFPAFDARKQDGAPVSLKTYEGKKKLIYWYPKADTPGCTMEGNGFKAMNKQYVDIGVQVLGMSADPPPENLKFHKKYGFNFPLLSDEARSVPKALGVQGRWAAFVGEKGKILKFWPSVDPTNFPKNAIAWMKDNPKQSFVKVA